MKNDVINCSDYIVIDLETTGFNCKKDKIIEIGAVFVENNIISEKLDLLINPGCKLPERIVALTGISDDMLANAPSIEQALPEFIEKINNKILVGHNIVSFDRAMLLENCKMLGLTLECDYVDTLPLSRQILPMLPSHSLDSICSALIVTNERSHRAVTDCVATYECFKKLVDISKSNEEYVVPPEVIINLSRRKFFSNSYTEETKSLQTLQEILIGITCDGVLTEDEVYTLKAWLDENRHLCGNYPFDRAEKAILKALEDDILEPSELEELLDIFKKLIAPDYKIDVEQNEYDFAEKRVCLTGDFKMGERTAVTNLLEEIGAIPVSNVNGKTDYLIVGGLGSDAWKHGTYGGKIKTAMELQEKGKDIVVMSEADFLKCIEQSKGAEEDELSILCKELNSEFGYSDDQKEVLVKGRSTSGNKGYSLYIESNLALKYNKSKKGQRITIRSSIFKGLNDLFSNLAFKESDGLVQIDFLPEDDVSDIVKSCVRYAAEHFPVTTSFGCCSRYEQCSDAMKCLHPLKIYSRRCAYRRNLESGKIFYGKNKNYFVEK